MIKRNLINPAIETIQSADELASQIELYILQHKIKQQTSRGLATNTATLVIVHELQRRNHASRIRILEFWIRLLVTWNMILTTVVLALFLGTNITWGDLKNRLLDVISPPAQAAEATDAYATISQGCELESCPDARLLYAIWRTETNVVDCRPYQNMPTPNKCVSLAGAKGPFQFMDGTWNANSEPNWDKWSLPDSARAASRKTKSLGLYDQTSKEAFAKRFSGSDGGQCWNCGNKSNAGIDGYDQALRVWEIWKNFLILRKPAESLVVSQAFNEPYPDSAKIRALGIISGLKHSNGVDFVKVENDRAIPFDVKNVVDGKILDIVESPQFGLIVKLQSTERPDVVIEYWHLGMVTVKKGDQIKVGEKIGIASGAGSASTGAHLHLRLLISGRDEDPMRFISP